jgi:hypothetical protein
MKTFRRLSPERERSGSIFNGIGLLSPESEKREQASGKAEQGDCLEACRGSEEQVKQRTSEDRDVVVVARSCCTIEEVVQSLNRCPLGKTKGTRLGNRQNLSYIQMWLGQARPVRL